MLTRNLQQKLLEMDWMTQLALLRCHLAFFKERVIPLVAGWFGEINKDFGQTIVKKKRQHPAILEKTPSPLINTEKRRSHAPHVVLVQESNWSPNCERYCNTMLNMSRLHYVRESASSQHKQQQIRRDKRNYLWYSEHTAPGYDSFQQFRNERGFQMNGW